MKKLVFKPIYQVIIYFFFGLGTMSACKFGK